MWKTWLLAIALCGAGCDRQESRSIPIDSSATPPKVVAGAVQPETVIRVRNDLSPSEFSGDVRTYSARVSWSGESESIPLTLDPTRDHIDIPLEKQKAGDSSWSVLFQIDEKPPVGSKFGIGTWTAQGRPRCEIDPDGSRVCTVNLSAFKNLDRISRILMRP